MAAACLCLCRCLDPDRPSSRVVMACCQHADVALFPLQVEWHDFNSHSTVKHPEQPPPRKALAMQES